MPLQTNEEIIRLIDEWDRNFAPPNFVRSEKNGKLLLDHVLKKYGLVTISYLNDALNSLAGQLDWTPQPKPKTQEELAAEFAAKELKRIEREKIENAKPFDIEARTKAVQVEKDEAKRQATAQAQIEQLIATYSVNGLPGRIDHGKSEAGRTALRGIRINKNGNYDAPLTLKVLQASYNYDTPAEIIRAAEKAIENIRTFDAREKQRIRSEERRFGR
jgi:hypothetical protein